MGKRNINKPIPPVTQTISGWPNKGEEVTIHEPGKVPVEIKKEFDRIMSDKPNLNKKYPLGILSTPGPYTQDWLDQHGLKVVYAHGKAVLQFKK